MSAFIADRTIMGVVKHEPLDYVPSKVNRLRIGGRNFHTVAGRNHATHLNAFDRSFDEFDGANPTGAHRP